jgi:CBS domain-containing protein
VKIVGRYLAPFLATIAGVESPPDLQHAVPGTLVELELEQDLASGLTAEMLTSEHFAPEDDRIDALMNDALIVAPEDTIGEVAERLLAADVNVAAVAEFGRLIGILTRHDLLRAYATRAHPSEARVRQWMTAEPVTIGAATPARTAATLMREYGIHHLVVTEGERPVGTLHVDDVAVNVPLPVGLGF